MTPIQEAFDVFADKLQAQADTRINRAMEAYNKCCPDFQSLIRHMTGFRGQLTENNLREHFDTLELLDELDNCIDNMECEIRSYKKE